MVKPADPFAYVHGHVPTDSDDARHDLRWQTVRWVLQHSNQTWARATMSEPGPNGYVRYMKGCRGRCALPR